MGPQQAVRYLDGLIIFYGKFYIPIPSFALVKYSCVGFLPWIMARRFCESGSSTWFFPSQKAFTQRSFWLLKLSPWFLLFSLCPALCYRVSQTASGFVLWQCRSACICHLSSFHQWIQPVLPPVFCPNMPCHSSLMTAAFFHVSFYFCLHSVLVIQPVWEHLPFLWSLCVPGKCPLPTFAAWDLNSCPSFCCLKACSPVIRVLAPSFSCSFSSLLFSLPTLDLP